MNEVALASYPFLRRLRSIYHLLYNFLQQLSGGAGGGGQVAGVEGHVAPLNALGGQSPHGGHVLSQAHGSNDLCSLFFDF